MLGAAQPWRGRYCCVPGGEGRSSIHQSCPARELHPCWEATYGTGSTYRHCSPSFGLSWGQTEAPVPAASNSQCSWVYGIFHTVSVKSWNFRESKKTSLAAPLDSPDMRKEPCKEVWLRWGAFGFHLHLGKQRMALLQTVAFWLETGKAQPRPTAFLRRYRF